MQCGEWGELGPLFGTVTLDANGNGTLRFAPAGEQWKIYNVSVIASSATLEATATLYERQISSATRHSATYSGSSGDNNQLDTPIELTDGKPLFVVWEGGDAGATATATVSGKKSVAGRGFRA